MDRPIDDLRSPIDVDLRSADLVIGPSSIGRSAI
jgi:hypothetical protein